MLIVTGAAGFIGSNLVKALNARGEDRIIAVDNLTHADKFRNLVDCEIVDYLDKDEFVERFARGDFGRVRAVFHEGACSDTMQTDGRYMMQNNYRYSLAVLDACTAQRAQFLYASSAAIYGGSTRFVETRDVEAPLNVYGYSKFLFDQVIRRRLFCAQNSVHSQIAGFRYFNVYGPREMHKGRMASVAFHNFNQFRAEGCVKLFGEYNGYEPGGQTRDFVSVEDVVKVNLYFFDHPEKSGIFNLGTGRAQPFNDIAHTVVNTLRELEGARPMEAALDKPKDDAQSAREREDAAPRDLWRGVKRAQEDAVPLTLDEQVARGLIEYVAFPDALRGKYQCFTQADLTKLRAAGYDAPFLTVQEGVARYVRWLFGQV